MWQTRSAERTQDGGWNGEGRPISDFADESGQTLREHLLWQLEMEHFTPREVIIGEAIVDSINDDGYLTADLEEIHDEPRRRAGGHGCAKSSGPSTKIQRLDPVGVGRAIDLANASSCNSASSTGIRLACSLRSSIATDQLDLVANRDYGELRRSLRTSEDDLHEALALVRGCNPKPGTRCQPAARPSMLFPMCSCARSTIAGRWKSARPAYRGCRSISSTRNCCAVVANMRC